ncbi:MAG TPA: hypothetical protein ENI39_03825 [Anaerolineae bacterium]|nr:hypothetical protein [Anaerolineae bacterium]
MISLTPSLVNREERISAENIHALELLNSRLEAGSLIWSDDHVVTLAGGYTTSPELSEMSWKRNESGLLTENQLGTLLRRDRPGAIVVSSGLFDSFPDFVACLDTYLEETALGGRARAYWANRRNLSQSLVDCVSGAGAR